MARANISDINKKKTLLSEYQDKNAIGEVIGCIIKKPDLIKNYPLRVDDFVDVFHRTLFSVIHNMIRDNAYDITPEVIESYLKENYPVKYEIFTKHSGAKYLADASELASLDNFEMNYNTVRKWSVLRELVQANIDVSEYFDPTDIAMDEEAEIKRDKFEEDSIDTILAYYKSKVLQISNLFNDRGARDQKKAGGLESLRQVDIWKQSPDFGLSYASQYLTTITYGLRRKRMTVLSAPSGTGKAIPNDTIIPTPIGYRRVGDIKEGDYLFGKDGLPTEVLQIHPQKSLKKVWEVHLADGRVAECCDQHLWEYITFEHKNEVHKVKDVRQLSYEMEKSKKNFFSRKKFFLPVNSSVGYPKKDFAIDPYAFGVMLEKNTWLNNSILTIQTNNISLVSRVAEALDASYEKDMNKQDTYYFVSKATNSPIELSKEQALASSMYSVLKQYYTNRYIPEGYILSSVSQRIDLLQGILDSSGSFKNKRKGIITYSTSSSRMIESMNELCRSLGMVTYCHTKHQFGDVVYTLRIEWDKMLKSLMFRCSENATPAIQHMIKGKRSKYEGMVEIVDIIPTERQTAMTCFTVDNPDHLYLMNDYIVTHNTRLAIANMCFSFAPYFWNSEKQQWEPNPHGTENSALYIGTEMELLEEVEPIIWAYMADVPEDHITQNEYAPGEEERVRQAIEYLRQKDENGKEKNCGIYMEYIPEYDVDTLESIIEQYVTMHNVSAVFFDYIYSNPKLLAEYAGASKGRYAMRDDQALANLSTKLKDLTRKYNISIDTCTQVSGAYKNAENYDETIVRGAKSIIDKCDVGIILTHPTERELGKIEPITRRSELIGKPLPNACLTVYKNRGGRYGKIKVWLFIDYHTMRVHDLFTTNLEYELLKVEKSRVVVDEDGQSHIFTNTDAMEQFKQGKITQETYSAVEEQEKEDPSYKVKTRNDEKLLKQAQADTENIAFVPNSDSGNFVVGDDFDDDDFDY